MKRWQLHAIVPAAVAMLLSMSSVEQGSMASDQPAPGTGLSFQPTMMRVVPYPDETSTLPGITVPYSCYRIGRCSEYDLYYFRDRPKWLTRLAPEAPAEGIKPPSIDYVWVFVPVTPEENILPRCRTASQVRDEFRAFGRLIDGPN